MEGGKSSLIEAGKSLGRSWGFHEFSNYVDGFCSRVFLSESEALKVPFQGEEMHNGTRAALALAEAKVGVEILKSDLSTGVILMRRLNPGTTLTLTSREESFARSLVCNFIKEIREINVAQMIPMEEYFETSNMLAFHLIRTSPKTTFLHGDLHHENILMHGDQWVVIDAKGVQGDPAYECAAFVRNPLGWIGEIEDLELLLKERIFLMAKELDLDPSRIWGWSLAELNPGDRVAWQRVHQALSNMAPLFCASLDLPPGTLRL